MTVCIPAVGKARRCSRWFAVNNTSKYICCSQMNNDVAGTMSVKRAQVSFTLELLWVVSLERITDCCLSVCLSVCPVHAHNSKRKRHRKPQTDVKVARFTCKWRLIFEIKMSSVLVTRIYVTEVFV